MNEAVLRVERPEPGPPRAPSGTWPYGEKGSGFGHGVRPGLAVDDRGTAAAGRSTSIGGGEEEPDATVYRFSDGTTRVEGVLVMIPGEGSPPLRRIRSRCRSSISRCRPRAGPIRNTSMSASPSRGDLEPSPPLDVRDDRLTLVRRELQLVPIGLERGTPMAVSTVPRGGPPAPQGPLRRHSPTDTRFVKQREPRGVMNTSRGR